jgi:hypothetical protein
MLRAQRSHQRYLQDADELPVSDTASMLTSNTRTTALTTFDFDSIIKATAVYQRCTRRRSEKTSLLSLAMSTGELTLNQGVTATVTREQRDSSYTHSHEGEIMKESEDLVGLSCSVLIDDKIHEEAIDGLCPDAQPKEEYDLANIVCQSEVPTEQESEIIPVRRHRRRRSSRTSNKHGPANVTTSIKTLPSLTSENLLFASVQDLKTMPLSNTPESRPFTKFTIVDDSNAATVASRLRSGHNKYQSLLIEYLEATKRKPTRLSGIVHNPGTRNVPQEEITDPFGNDLMDRQLVTAVEYIYGTSQPEESRHEDANRSHSLMDLPIQDRTRSASHERIRQKVIEKLLQRQREELVLSMTDLNQTKERRRRSSRIALWRVR